MTSGPEFDQALADLAEQLGCTLEELHSSMQEAGRVHFELAPSEHRTPERTARYIRSRG